MIRGRYLAIIFYWILSIDRVCRSVRLFRPATGTALVAVNRVMQQTKILNCPTLPTLVSGRRKQRCKLANAGFYAKVQLNKTACLELQQPMLVDSAVAVVSIATVFRRLSGLSRHRNVHLLDSDLIYHAVASVNHRRHDVS